MVWMMGRMRITDGMEPIDKQMHYFILVMGLLCALGAVISLALMIRQGRIT
jgi:hypothetical protein